ncbi:ORF10 [Halorubrum pleomorphic virus 2]|uniref:ORF10 n=1 Tax=Halorubrum pleomorphic virus 2 TaxID=1156719 RepID=H9ABM4_9VIRU|nr:ORF10 [Halorubrum pleomorphic virus 2]AFD03994.1 ORF10 [Halorubrum pleomorphic virus 2]
MRCGSVPVSSSCRRCRSMSETSFVEALDGARRVRAAWIGGHQVVVVWHGGVGFNVYANKTTSAWVEVDYFSMSDEQGEPVSESEADEAMVEHIERRADFADMEVMWDE